MSSFLLHFMAIYRNPTDSAQVPHRFHPYNQKSDIVRKRFNQVDPFLLMQKEAHVRYAGQFVSHLQSSFAILS